MPLSDGEIFAGFRIIRLLGSGAMGEVYLVQHPRLPRRNALKVLPADVSADREYRARFSREADLASTLYHPHIVGVHDRGELRRAAVDLDGLRRRRRRGSASGQPVPGGNADR
jgi:serine/threonine protein kinase, bacterial